MQTTWRASSSEQHYGAFRPSKSKAWACIFVENAHVFFSRSDPGLRGVLSKIFHHFEDESWYPPQFFCWKKTIQKRIFPTKSNIQHQTPQSSNCRTTKCCLSLKKDPIFNPWKFLAGCSLRLRPPGLWNQAVSKGTRDEFLMVWHPHLLPHSKLSPIISKCSFLTRIACIQFSSHTNPTPRHRRGTRVYLRFLEQRRTQFEIKVWFTKIMAHLHTKHDAFYNEHKIANPFYMRTF